MLSKQVLDLVRVKKVDGREKPVYTKHGIIVIDDEAGKVSVLVESVPVGENWNGWFSGFAKQDRQDNGPEAF